MPNRYLRESFIESDSVNSISIHAEAMWVRLIVNVDDWGRCEASLRLLRPKLFPLRLDQVTEADIQKWIHECEQAGLVRCYECDGKAYLQMIKWEKGRAAASKYPQSPDIESGCLQPYTNANICIPPLSDACGCLQMLPTPTPTPITTPTLLAESTLKPGITESEENFVAWFLALLSETGAPSPKLTQSGRESWAKCYTKMLRLDMRTDEQIRDVCRWARNDKFWSGNFMSPMKLRDKKDDVMWFDHFVNKMSNGRSSAATTKTPMQLRAEAEGWR